MIQPLFRSYEKDVLYLLRTAVVRRLTGKFVTITFWKKIKISNSVPFMCLIGKIVSVRKDHVVFELILGPDHCRIPLLITNIRECTEVPGMEENCTTLSELTGRGSRWNQTIDEPEVTITDILTNPHE